MNRAKIIIIPRAQGRDSSSPKSSFRMTKQEKYSSEGQKKHHKNVILNDSEESRILNGRIKNENRKHFYYYHPTLIGRDSSSPKKLVQNDKSTTDKGRLVAL
jgi:hypothetical protein